MPAAAITVAADPRKFLLERNEWFIKRSFSNDTIVLFSKIKKGRYEATVMNIMKTRDHLWRHFECILVGDTTTTRERAEESLRPCIR